MRHWVNAEIEKETADAFKQYLRSHNIKYEASEADNLIHFECFMNESEIIAANEFLGRI